MPLPPPAPAVSCRGRAWHPLQARTAAECGCTLSVDQSKGNGYGPSRRQPMREGTMMQVTVDLLDEFAQRLQAKWQDTLSHYARERLVMEAYRHDLVSTREVQELLGLDDRFAVYDLCKKYDIVLYTLEDLEQDRATARQLGL